MNRSKTMRAAVAAAITGIALMATAPMAAAESDARLEHDGDRHAWSGAPPVPANPVPTEPPASGCLDPQAPLCDHEYVEIVNSGEPFRVLVEISSDGPESDDYDLFVYDEDGNLVGSSAASGSDEQVELFDPPSGVYDIAVQPYAVDPDSSYSGQAELIVGGDTHDGPYDLFEDDCLEPVPARIGPPYVADVGQRVELDVLVLLDGLTEAEAAPHLADAARSYEPLGIDMVVTYGALDVPADGENEGRLTAEGVAVNQFAREALGGVRPPGIDIVYTLTTKDLWSVDGEGRSYGLLGVADCIGGVRHDHRAFATGEVTSMAGFTFQGLEVFPIRGYRTTAHEIGHLMGAHHHYFNCVEGVPTEADEGEISPCTIMAPYVDLQSDNFGQLEVAVIRAHALAFAADDAPPPVVPESPVGTAVLAAAGAVAIALMLRRGSRADAV